MSPKTVSHRREALHLERPDKHLELQKLHQTFRHLLHWNRRFAAKLNHRTGRDEWPCATKYWFIVAVSSKEDLKLCKATSRTTVPDRHLWVARQKTSHPTAPVLRKLSTRTVPQRAWNPLWSAATSKKRGHLAEVWFRAVSQHQEDVWMCEMRAVWCGVLPSLAKQNCASYSCHSADDKHVVEDDVEPVFGSTDHAVL